MWCWYFLMGAVGLFVGFILEFIDVLYGSAKHERKMTRDQIKAAKATMIPHGRCSWITVLHRIWELLLCAFGLLAAFASYISKSVSDDVLEYLEEIQKETYGMAPLAKFVNAAKRRAAVKALGRRAAHELFKREKMMEQEVADEEEYDQEEEEIIEEREDATTNSSNHFLDMFVYELAYGIKHFSKQVGVKLNGNHQSSMEKKDEHISEVNKPEDKLMYTVDASMYEKIQKFTSAYIDIRSLCEKKQYAPIAGNSTIDDLAILMESVVASKPSASDSDDLDFEMIEKESVVKA